MKTIEITVVIQAEIPDDVGALGLTVNTPLNQILIGRAEQHDGTNLIKEAKVTGYETIDVEVVD